jgi:hypothetical protein
LPDVKLQLEELRAGLSGHFDTIDVVEDLKIEELRQQISMFLLNYGNDSNARLFIYYAGHGYSEPILQFSEYRGYITGIDTPSTENGYDAARPNAMSMIQARSLLAQTLAKHVLLVFDSCFAGSIFISRTDEPPRMLKQEEGALTRDEVLRAMEKPSRDIITAGDANERVPAHSPIPRLLLAALGGEADRYHHGVISASEIKLYLADQVRHLPDVNLTPQKGKLLDPNFSQGDFLFRIINRGPEERAPVTFIDRTFCALFSGRDDGDCSALCEAWKIAGRCAAKPVEPAERPTSFHLKPSPWTAPVGR